MVLAWYSCVLETAQAGPSDVSIHQEGMRNVTEYIIEKVKLVTFTLDVPGFPHIVWNISQIEHDAFRGRFGAPEEGVFAELQQWDNPEDYWRHVEKPKVLNFIRLAHVPAKKPDWETKGATKREYRLIDIPTITLITPRADGVYHAFPVDGNHRMLARIQLRYKTFPRFTVPASLEREYRL